MWGCSPCFSSSVACKCLRSCKRIGLSPSAYVKSRLQALKEATPALVAERKARDEQDKIYKEQLQEMHRNKLTGEQLDEKIRLARKAIGQ